MHKKTKKKNLNKYPTLVENQSYNWVKYFCTNNIIIILLNLLAILNWNNLILLWAIFFNLLFIIIKHNTFIESTKDKIYIYELISIILYILIIIIYIFNLKINFIDSDNWFLIFLCIIILWYLAILDKNNLFVNETIRTILIYPLIFVSYSLMFYLYFLIITWFISIIKF